MDSGRFDTLAKTLAQVGTRRSLMAGSLAAAALAALGLGEAAVARKRRGHAEAKQQDRPTDRVTTEDKLGIGARCDPANREHGKKHGCRKCRTQYSVKTKNGKGKTIRKCACKPVGEPSSRDKQWQCCSGQSDGSRCVNAAAAQETCQAVGTTCAADAQCCNGICNAGGSRTGRLAGIADTCAACKTGRASCNPAAPQDECCRGGGDFRRCTDAPGPGGFECSSANGEQCVPDPAATPTAPRQGSCGDNIFICPVAGNSGPQGVCCTTSDQARQFDFFICPQDASRCCTGACKVVSDQGRGICCVPDGENPTRSGGAACTSATPVANDSCCSGFCTGATAETSVCVPSAS
jgi:hypothetical protein